MSNIQHLNNYLDEMLHVMLCRKSLSSSYSANVTLSKSLNSLGSSQCVFGYFLLQQCDIVRASATQGDHFLENLEMSGIMTAVREMFGILLKVSEVSRTKSCQRKVVENCLLLVAYLRPYDI